MTGGEASYGSDATLEKLDAIERYGGAFTTALKNTAFSLVYVDGFAGRGTVRLREGGRSGEIVRGSALRALDTQDRRFDKLILIEKDANNAAALRNVIADRDELARAEVIHGDANQHLPRFSAWLRHRDRRMHRAFVFVDPFATQLDWTTIAALADTKRCDVLMLIPLMAVRRLIKRDAFPTAPHAVALDRIFGDESWRDLYTETGVGAFSDGGFRAIVELYVARLETKFVRVVDPKRTLGASSEPSMFTLLFGASNERGADVAARIAEGVFEAAQGAQGRMRL